MILARPLRGLLAGRLGHPVHVAALASTCLIAASPARANDPPTFADRGASAVDDDDRTVLLAVQPLAVALGVFGLEGDFALAPRVALAVEVAALRRIAETGLALDLGALFFPLRGAFHGLYFEPRVAYGRPLREPIMRASFATDALGLGGVAGWEWTWDYGLSLRLGTGARYYVGSSRSVSSMALDAVALGTIRVELVVDASVGWAF